MILVGNSASGTRPGVFFAGFFAAGRYHTRPLMVRLNGAEGPINAGGISRQR